MSTNPLLTSVAVSAGLSLLTIGCEGRNDDTPPPPDVAVKQAPGQALETSGSHEECGFCQLAGPSAPPGTKYCPSLRSEEAELTPTPPQSLEETGLYCDMGQRLTAPGVIPFRPRFHLWSDGSVKTRWIYLPPGAKIDTADQDHWDFPVGTKAWKQFVFAGRPVETRLIVRYGEADSDYYFATYRWNEEGTAAQLVPDEGVREAAPISDEVGAPRHDIPSQADCLQCHAKLREKYLGFSALQLSHEMGGETIATLVAGGRLTQPPRNPEGYAIPGDAIDHAALGFLHANCGHCHNDTGVIRPTPLRLRLLVGETRVEDTGIYVTGTSPPSTAGDFNATC
jgi:hypothetical protein